MHKFEKMLGGCKNEMSRSDCKRCAVSDQSSVIRVEYTALRQTKSQCLYWLVVANSYKLVDVLVSQL